VYSFCAAPAMLNKMERDTAGNTITEVFLRFISNTAFFLLVCCLQPGAGLYDRAAFASFPALVNSSNPSLTRSLWV
jgi:hypothetical protein